MNFVSRDEVEGNIEKFEVLKFIESIESYLQ